MGVVSTREVDNQHDSALALLAILGMVPELSFLWHKTKEHLQCNSCREVTTCEVQNSLAPVDIPDQERTRPFSAAECIQNHFTAVEGNIQRRCTICHANTSTKSTTLPFAPPFLMIHLKRFTQRRNRTQKINTDAIPFSELDIQTEQGPSTYEVLGSINHIGATMSQGHYTAYIDHNQYWYLCNDDRILSIDSRENNPSQPTQSAYVILLKQVNWLIKFSQRIVEAGDELLVFKVRTETNLLDYVTRLISLQFPFQKRFYRSDNKKLILESWIEILNNWEENKQLHAEYVSILNCMQLFFAIKLPTNCKLYWLHNRSYCFNTKALLLHHLSLCLCI